MDEPVTDPTTNEAPARTTRPVTGDRAVDDALAQLDRALDGDPQQQLEAATEAHRLLQARLTTPTPAEPGQARPGPPGA